MSKLAKFLLAATAFAPILLVYTVVSVINHNYYHAAAFMTGCAVLIFMCVALLRFASREIQSMDYRTETVEVADGEVFGLLLVYLLPLINRDLDNYNWPIWFLVMSLFCLVVATSYGYHFNPLLIFLGYHFYKVKEKDKITHILITRRRIYKTRESLKVARIATYILFEKKPSN